MDKDEEEGVRKKIIFFIPFLLKENPTLIIINNKLT